MAGACCEKPKVRTIRIAEFEAGLNGLDQALNNVYVSGLTDKEDIRRALLKWIREFGNYITPSREGDYGSALLREYREYVERVKAEEKQNAGRARAG